MTLIRWSPWRDLARIQEDMDRLYNAFFSGTPTKLDSGSMVWNPAVDIHENDNEFIVVAEIPGMKKEDVKISLQDNVLTISGEKKREKEEEKKTYHRIEREYGSFERSFSLPSSVKVDSVKATYKDGLLTITLPKSEEAKPKEISISVS